VIEDNHGVVDKYTGDSVMALFGAPLSRENDAANAVQAALDIQECMVQLNQTHRQEGIGLMEAGIGVHTGLVVAGNLGSQNRLNYTVIGDSVNLSARLEGLTRKYNTANIVSEACVRNAPEFIYRELDLVQVAGKSEPVRIYEAVGTSATITNQQQLELTAFAQALASYRAQRWDEAIAKFEHLQLSLPEAERRNSLYSVYLDRMRYLSERDLPVDWDAVFVFDRK
jgi:adenylate cyclase